LEQHFEDIYIKLVVVMVNFNAESESMQKQFSQQSRSDTDVTEH
jgi:hypothetical protein